MNKVSLLMALILVCVSAYAKSPIDNSKLFIKLKPGLKLPTLNEKTEHIIGDIFVVHTKDAKTLAKSLVDNSSVEYVEYNRVSQRKKLPKLESENLNNENIYSSTRYIFNDPYANKVWSFADSEKHGSSIAKAYAQPLNRRRAQIIVAVADTGVDYRHEDLKDVMWVNRDEIPGNGIDDDNNGYVDDVYGYDFLSNDSDPMASHWHGTHVAGTIAARQNNGLGIAGIASNVKIMALRVVPDNGDETDYNVGKAFVYAAKNGARIINCSFGKNNNERGQHVADIMKEVNKRYGTLVVAAAGNDYFRDIDSRPTYPASFSSENLLVIASTTNRGKLSSFTNVGKKNVDLAAPGSSIYSTINNNRYGSASGTSMATPTTVGIAAEVLSHFPNLTGVQLKHIMIDSVSKVQAYSGYMVSGGRANLYRALRYAQKYYTYYKRKFPRNIR